MNSNWGDNKAYGRKDEKGITKKSKDSKKDEENITRRGSDKQVKAILDPRLISDIIGFLERSKKFV